MKRKQIKPKKTPRKALRKKLDKLFRTYILRRDKNICQKCDKYVEGVNCHISHVIPKSYSLRMIYDLVNAKVLCFSCHLQWWHLHIVEAGEWYKTKFPKRWDYLQTRKQEVLKMGGVKDYELEEWIKEFE